MSTPKLVEEILRDLPSTRNDDKLLILEVWERLGLVLTPEQQEIYLDKKVPSTETITRERRNLSTKYPPARDVGVRRAQTQMEYHRRFRKPYQEGLDL